MQKVRRNSLIFKIRISTAYRVTNSIISHTQKKILNKPSRSQPPIPAQAQGSEVLAREKFKFLIIV
jgi:hypothetical protein